MSQTVSRNITDNIILKEYEDGFLLGTDAVLLVRFVHGSRKKKCADLGTGSGVIPLLLFSENKIGNATGFEIQPRYAELANENSRENGFEAVFKTYNVDIRDIRSVENGELYGKYDIVTVNPPFFKAGTGAQNESEYKRISRHELNGDIYDFCDAASYLLKYGGSLNVVYRPERTATLLCAMKKFGLEPKRLNIISSGGKATTVLVEAIKGAAEGIKIDIVPSRPIHT